MERQNYSRAGPAVGSFFGKEARRVSEMESVCRKGEIITWLRSAGLRSLGPGVLVTWF